MIEGAPVTRRFMIDGSPVIQIVPAIEVINGACTDESA